MTLARELLNQGFISNPTEVRNNGSNDLNDNSVECVVSNKVLVVSRIMTPRDVQVLIPGICEYVKFTRQKGFCRYDKIRVFEMSQCTGLCGWAQCDQKSTYKGK